MPLDYLDFDVSEDEDGACTFDAMAAVPAAHWPRLEAEVLHVLGWALDTFGPPSPPDEGGDWDCELQAIEEVATPLDAQWSPGALGIALQRAPAAPPRISFSLTLSGSPAFGDAFRAAFGLD